MEDLRDKYEVVIGLEVHAQLKTKSKIFAPDGCEFGKEPNSETSPITLGMPGVLPVLNKECVNICLLYTSPSPRDRCLSRMPSSA